jgi:hypothetical protein
MTGAAIEELVEQLARNIALSIEVFGILVLAIGSLEAMVAVVRRLFMGPFDAQRRAAWLRYAHWLVAGLTFQCSATTGRHETTQRTRPLSRLLMCKTRL